MLSGGGDAGDGCCLQAETSTLFPIMSSPVVMCSTSAACSNSWTPVYSKLCSWKLRHIFPPVVPNILLSFNFTASLQLLKYDSRKTAIKRKVFQLQHLINKETHNFLLQIQRRGFVLEKQTNIFAVLPVRPSNDSAFWMWVHTMFWILMTVYLWVSTRKSPENTVQVPIIAVTEHHEAKPESK